MPVDVPNEIVIDRPLDVVAPYAVDPTNTPEWYANISSVDWETLLRCPPVRVSASWRTSLVAVWSTRTRWSTHCQANAW
jgi:hypothetical protein